MGIYRVPVQILGNFSGAPGVNVWHLRTNEEGVTGKAQLESLMANLRTFYNTCSTRLASGVQIVFPTDVVRIDVTPKTFQAVTPPATVTASGTGSAPAMTQICVGWRTSVATRRGRGRTFLGPIAGGIVDADGSPTAITVSDIQGAADTLVNTSMGSANGAVVIYSELDAVGRDIIGARVRDRFAVLTSRRD